MANSYKKILKMVVSFATLATSSVQAYDEGCCYTGCSRFFIDAEALYLRPYQGGISSLCDVVDVVETNEDGVLVSTLTGRGHDPKEKWDWGYRIGAGYGDECGSGIAAYWTHFNSKNHGERVRWKFDYDVVDALFRYNYKFSDSVTLTPFAGVKFAKIDQKIHSNFLSTFDGSPITTTGAIKQEFTGTGPEFGFEADWDMYCGLSLYGNLAVSLLYGTSPVKVFETDIGSTGTNINRSKNHRKSYQTVLDAGIGLRWKTLICNETNLTLQVGLEDHRYFNHNQFSCGDLSLNGVNMGLSIDF